VLAAWQKYQQQGNPLIPALYLAMNEVIDIASRKNGDS
jgi:hypothetical protein